jgi:hypothetical protein
MVGLYLSILRGYGKDKGVPHARVRAGTASGRVGPWARQAGMARFCHSPLIIAEVSTLLHYGKVG